MNYYMLAPYHGSEAHKVNDVIAYKGYYRSCVLIMYASLATPPLTPFLSTPEYISNMA